jgi:hypothetical protein
MRRILTIAAAILGVVVGAQTALATPIQVIRSFSQGAPGAASGFLNPNALPAPDEPWAIGCVQADCPKTDFGWGSPGVDQFITPYDETTAATDFEITFTGVSLDPAEITIGSASACAGRGDGGTTFCAATGDPWTPSFDPSHPSSIAFFAPAGVSLAPGTEYFVNIFLLGAQPTSVEFSGAWTTEATPEPGSLLLLGTGLAFGARRLRRKFGSKA